MLLVALAVASIACVSAFLGGWIALRAVRYVGVIIAVGAGIRIGAAFFDLIPEAIEQLGSLEAAMVWTTLGFLAFYFVEHLTSLHVGHETAVELDHGSATHEHLGTVGAAGMGLHSFLDGVALAAALAVGGGTGLIIAVVVVVHRFGDGIGVVSFLAASRTADSLARRWLTFVAVAPIVGVLVGAVLAVPDVVLGAMLGFFAGFFLYVGAAELLPEAHRRDRSRLVALGTIAGTLGIYVLSVGVGALGATMP